MVTVGLVWVNFCPALWVNYTPAVTHGNIILERTHDKCAYQTSEVPDEFELDRFEDVYDAFRNEISFDDSSEKSWYKTGKEDILILWDPNEKSEKLEPLSRKSSIVRAMQPIKQKRLYVRNGTKRTVKEKIAKYLEGKGKNERH
jgi:glutamine synthetase